MLGRQSGRFGPIISANMAEGLCRRDARRAYDWRQRLVHPPSHPLGVAGQIDNQLTNFEQARRLALAVAVIVGG